MTVQEYTRKLERSKNLAIDRFGNLTSLEKTVINISFDWLLQNLEVKSGSFVATDNLTQLMNDFVNSVISIIENNKDYQKKLVSYLSDVTTLGNNITGFQQSYNKIDFANVGLREVQNTLINETINQFTTNGLNKGFVQPLRDLMFRNVVSGLNLRQAKTVLTDYIFAGNDKTGKLSKYLLQTAQQAVDSYAGAINAKLYDSLKFTGYIISGSLIDTSSKQCIHAVELSKATGGYLTNAQWSVILDEARKNNKAKLIEGTTLKNLPINKLHWGCRHEFTPVIKK